MKPLVKNGFSLIELLLVLMILGLVGTAMSVMNHAIQKKQSVLAAFPVLRQAMVQTDPKVARSLLADPKVNGLDTLGTLSLPGPQASVEVSVSNLWVDDCRFVQAMLLDKDHLDWLKQVRVSINGTPMTDADAVKDFYCGSHAVYTLRVKPLHDLR